jgi:3-oxoacyl-[acyl-carrier-protein] synthase-3
MMAAACEFGLEDVRTAFAGKTLSPMTFGFDLPQDYYQNVSGAQTLTVAESFENAFTLCARAAENILRDRAGAAAQLDAIFVVTLPTEPTVAPISSRLQAHVGAPASTFCMDLTLSCVGFLQAASTILDMMPARGWKKVLLLNVETLTKIIRPEDQPLRLIMSDGATAALFTDQPRVVFDQFEFFSDGSLASILGTADGKMAMDGLRLYETVIRRIPNSFRQTIEKFGLQQNAIDLFLFHQGSRKVLDKLIERLELEPRKVPQTIAQTGNLGSCSLPHLLDGILHDRPSETRQIFATAFGAGFQWAHASLQQKG